MKAADFIAKWSDATLRERQGSQEHFIDLCRLLDQPTPAEDDPHGERYCFERGATKAGGGDGWADVWRRGCFGWEYKGPHKDLNAAFRQLSIYASALENPPYLVVSDMARIVIHTNWTNTVSQVHELSLEDLREPHKLDLLRQVFEGSDRLRPSQSPQELTAKVAARFGDLGRRLQDREHDPREVAHFLNRLVFCMFAEDAGLLPNKLFTRLIRSVETRATVAASKLDDLFKAMSTGGDFGVEIIRWFNGGLFEEALKATRKRAALGAHYTDREKILKIVEPVVVWPLAAEWDAALAEIKSHAAAMKTADADRRAVLEEAAAAMKADPASAKAGEAARRKKLSAIARRRDGAYREAKDRLEAYLARLAAYRVLDPACGSGNFLYVALQALKDLELRAIIDAERAAGIPQQTPRVGLNNVRGIEIEPYAAELARVTLWIGDLQWMKKNGFTGWTEPILSTLAQIENRDALLNPDGTEAAWPKVDAIVGNPPFVGASRMIGAMGVGYVDTLRTTYIGRVPGFADLVAFWVEKAWRAIQNDRAVRAGLVTTNSIRGGANRIVLDLIAQQSAIWEARPDEPWALDGAAVRVSMIGFGSGFLERRLDEIPVDNINADLTSSLSDLTTASKLQENSGFAFLGTKKGGPFNVNSDQAQSWLLLKGNPNGQPNSRVLKPRITGSDIVRRPELGWVIDFGVDISEAEASLYEAPFQFALTHVKPVREKNRREIRRRRWWLHSEPAPALRRATADLHRFIGTPRVAKYRIFVWLHPAVLVDDGAGVIARDDDAIFGILHSRFHELWSLRMGTSLGVGNDPRYTPSTTFETFPFPEGLTPNIPAVDYAEDPRAVAIAEAAAELNRLREAWLNPPDLVRIEPEVVPGYPDRVLPKDEAAAKVLKTRTLTNLYNQRPAWLDMAHRRLDAAVAAAYGWPADLTDDEVLERLFALNQERARAGR